jgi:hypothetical protein
MAESKKSAGAREMSDSKGTFQVLFAVAIGLGLVLVLGVVQGAEKCALGAAKLRQNARTWLRSFDSKGRIQDSETESVSSVSSSH